jgi:hypothetical protein
MSVIRKVFGSAVNIPVVVLLVCIAGCASRTHDLPPAPSEVRRSIQRIGIIGPPSATMALGLSESQTASIGYMQGVRGCAEFWKPRNPLDIPMHTLATLMYCPTFGGLIGTAIGPPKAYVAEAVATLEQVVGGASVSEAVRTDLAALLANRTPQYTPAVVVSDSASESSSGADTLLVLNNLRVTFMLCDHLSDDRPYLTLYTGLDAELLRAADRKVLHRARVESWSEDSMPITVWAATDAERYRAALQANQHSLAEQIVQSFFVADAPIEVKVPRCAIPLVRSDRSPSVPAAP